jgi:glutathione S-transferase
MFWAASHFSPPISALVHENMLKPMFGLGTPDASRIAHAENELRTLGAVLDAHLATRAWVCGDAITLADIAIACPLKATLPARLPITDLANLARWFSQVKKLDAWKETAAG